jgi:hypothetical protein
LCTESGRRKHAARWRYWAAVATLSLGLAYVSAWRDQSVFAGGIIIGGVLAYRAGMLKAEHDRLNQQPRHPDTLRFAVRRAAIFFVLTLAVFRLGTGEWSPGWAAYVAGFGFVIDCARLWSNRPVGQDRALSNSRDSR